MSLRERLLLRRLKDRDEDAFRALVERYQDGVVNFLYRLVGNRAEAEDLAQEAFLLVFKSIDRFEGRGKLSTWLFQIAANVARNRLKYLRRRSYQEHDAWDDEASGAAAAGGRAASAARPVAAQVDGPEQLASAHQLERIVQAGLASLEDDLRLLLVLRDIEDLSYEEIAEVTEQPVGTVKSRLHRARALLKDHLDRHTKEG